MRVIGPIPPRASANSRTSAPVPMVKMVTFWVDLTLARILSSVSREKVSRPVPMRMMYLRPSIRLVTVERFVEGVEEVGIGEAGDDKRGERIADDLLVVGEVGQDVSAEIVGDNGDVVVRTQGVEEAEGRVLHVADEVVAVGGELEQHDRRDRSLGHADICDLLGNSILEDEEVACLEAGHELVSFIENDIDVEVDDGNVDAKRVGFVIGILNLWLRRGYGRRRRCLLLLLFLMTRGPVSV